MLYIERTNHYKKLTTKAQERAKPGATGRQHSTKDARRQYRPPQQATSVGSSCHLSWPFLG